MEMRKSNWVVDEHQVHLAVPFAKVDKENRLVSGFATLDNIDKQKDVVLNEASKAAFESFRGNIREMHQPIAAGRLVDFKEEEYFHDGEFYHGIYATVYVSKGAQDTWEKVLDGTLSGFSIGGNIVEEETKFVKDAGPNGANVRFIKAYQLSELSLVDNPANQLANVFSIVKSADGALIKGMVADTVVVNVFWCQSDEIAKNSTNETEDCLNCGSAMERIGWFEKGEDDAVQTATTVAKFLRQKEDNDAVTKQDDITANGEGGVEMTDEITKSAEEDVVTSEEVVEEAPVEGATDVDVVVDEAPAEPDFEKMFDDLKSSVTDSIEKTVKTVEQKMEETTAAFDKKASEFEKSLEELSEGLKAIKEERQEVAKRLDALESATAFKKSGEVETTKPGTEVKKSLWSGTFFPSMSE